MAFKTPGIYIEEIATFPPSVVAVETAIPAFVGYTEKAVGADGRSLALVPTRIRSLLEFEERFGGAFLPSTYRVQVNVAAGNTIGAVSPRDGANERRYYLYESLRHFYANGGGPCYVVSAGLFGSAPTLGTASPAAGLAGGLARIESLDEPTLLLFPDGVSLTAAELGSLQSAALAQCEKLKDRFLIADLRQGFRAAAIGVDPVGDFRQQIGVNNLKYGAAYYPWVQTIYRPGIRFHQLVPTDPADAVLANGVLDAFSADAAINALVPAARTANANAASVMATITTAPAIAGLTVTRRSFAGLPGLFAGLQAALRALPADAAEAPIRAAFLNVALLVRKLALGLPALDADASLVPTLAGQVDGLRADSGLVAAVIELIGLEKNEDMRRAISATRAVADVQTDYAALNGTPWILPHADVTAVPANAVDFGDVTPAALRRTALNVASALQAPFDRLAAAIGAVYETAELLAGQAEQRLFTQHPVYRGMLEKIESQMSLLPAGGGVAGVYAATDRGRGVWKAPANVSLSDVVGPAVKLNDQDQAELNVHPTGKSVNALRSFTGKGTLVWGARTLAGNDNEWRYVPVRRFFNLAEESIKKATEPFVFEPNDAGTWVRVRAMIENFLTVQWRQGALAGATPAQAFYVRVGLGETMTAQDILEGRLIIEMGLAVVRPAEFIVLKFSHKMQVS